jgi:hypothetical protein
MGRKSAIYRRRDKGSSVLVQRKRKKGEAGRAWGVGEEKIESGRYEGNRGSVASRRNKKRRRMRGRLRDSERQSDSACVSTVGKRGRERERGWVIDGMGINGR